jgi:predicted phage gp36 major capsid-like protein
MRELEVKATLTTQSDPDGGYLVPVEMEGTIDRVLGTVSAIRSIANVLNDLDRRIQEAGQHGGAGSGLGRRGGIPSRNRNADAARDRDHRDGAVRQSVRDPEALDDARIDVAQWLADEVSIAFAEKEGAAFVNGTGVKQPRACSSIRPSQRSYAWGSLGFVVTGAAAAFAATNPADALIDLYFALKQGYRNGATFVTSDVVMATIRKFKDGQGNYLFSPPTGVDAGDVARQADRHRRQHAGARRECVPGRVRQLQARLHDRRPHGHPRAARSVHQQALRRFYTTKRVGGGVTNFEAIKLLKCST